MSCFSASNFRGLGGGLQGPSSGFATPGTSNSTRNPALFSSAAPDAAASLDIIRNVTRQVCSSFYTCTDVAAILTPVQLLLQDPSKRVALAATDEFQALYGALMVKVAESYITVRENRDAKGRANNRGVEVDQFLTNVGVEVGNPWCAAFVYSCALGAARLLSNDSERRTARTTCPRTSAARDLWYKSKSLNTRFTKAQVLQEQIFPRAGDIFVNETVKDGKIGRHLENDKGESFPSHTGIVKSYEHDRKRLVTIEGNTNEGGSREGVGVFERTDRMQSVNLYGFVRPKILFV